MKIYQNIEYKIELRHSIWFVFSCWGVYSDRDNDQHFFSANSAEEAWVFYCNYIAQKMKRDPDDYYSQIALYSDEFGWFDLRPFLNVRPGYYSDDPVEELDKSYAVKNVIISPLSVINVSNL